MSATQEPLTVPPLRRCSLIPRWLYCVVNVKISLGIHEKNLHVHVEHRTLPCSVYRVCFSVRGEGEVCVCVVLESMASL
jgi:hypothetical protein